jgi:hypothetical protein
VPFCWQTTFLVSFPSYASEYNFIFLHWGWVEQSLKASWVFLDTGFYKDTFPSWQDNNLIILIMCSSPTIPIPGRLLSEFYYRNASRHTYICRKKYLMPFKRLGFCFQKR